jgi:hypothetical protein
MKSSQHFKKIGGEKVWGKARSIEGLNLIKTQYMYEYCMGGNTMMKSFVKFIHTSKFLN